MYRLTFKEFHNDPAPKILYFYSLTNAVTMQRALLINEINSFISDHTEVYTLNLDLFDETTTNPYDTKTSKMHIEDLQKLLRILIKLVYHDEEYQMSIDIDEIKCEDKPVF